MSSWNLAKTENYLKDVDHNIWISNRYVKGVLDVTKLFKNEALEMLSNKMIVSGIRTDSIRHNSIF